MLTGSTLSKTFAGYILLMVGLTAVSCGDGDGSGSEAQRRGVAAQCASDDDCSEDGQVCLDEFKGGYCGIGDCTADSDCPAGSECVAHEGANYCFLLCDAKPECNAHRDEENEANCSSSVTFVDPDVDSKACVPPSSGE